MPDIVNGLLLREGQILVARRSSHRASYPNTWSFPGGHVEQGETFEQALARELSEEIGVVPRSSAFLTTLNDQRSREVGAINFHLFAVDQWEGEPMNLGDEHSELRWVDLSIARELPDLALASYDAVFETLMKL